MTAKSYYMENSSNIQYYGSLYLGSEKEKHEFIFDTGSPWLWVASTGCIVANQNRCHDKPLFDTTQSSSFARVSNEVQDLNYEVGQATGYIAREKVCLSSDDSACVDE